MTKVLIRIRGFQVDDCAFQRAFCEFEAVNLLLESFCCKKSPNQEIGLRRFSEYQTSEGRDG